jgi:hypothetical protein
MNFLSQKIRNILWGAVIFGASTCSVFSMDTTQIPLDENEEHAVRISYHCPKNDLLYGNNQCSYLAIQLPNGVYLRSKGFGSSKNEGTRYTLFHLNNGFWDADKNRVGGLILKKQDCPYVLRIYPVTGYLVNNKMETLGCYEVSLTSDQLTRNLEAIRITHTKESVTDLKLQFRYTPVPTES